MDVFTLDGVLDADRCRWVRTAMDATAGERAQVLNDGEGRLAIDVDVSDDVIDFVESRLDAQRDRIAAFFRMALRGREGAGFLRYEAGGFYGPHVDRAEMPSWPDAARRAVTIVLFLNSSREADPTGGFSGGCLRVFGSCVSGLAESHRDVVPKAGMLVAFPSSTAHEVMPVVDGCRDAVVDWFYS
jgi:predicted 2-oxoglutarate/Fe(II)-dependent dioxygenase YbiX